MFSGYPAVRIIIYSLSIAAQIAAVFIAITNPQLSTAFNTVAGILGALAGGTALSNISKPNDGDTGFRDAPEHSA